MHQSKSRVTLKKSRHSAQRRVVKARIRAKRPMHRKILLHPTSLFILLCVGVFMAGATYYALAATEISSVIEAPPLQAPALITNPPANSSVTVSPITVSGTCPTNSYVTLQLNGSFDGVAWCTAANTFQITTSLYSGENDLLAQDYNSTDLAGPASPGIKVYYRPPHSAAAAASPAAPASLPPSTPSANETTAGTPETIQPMVLISDFKFKTFIADKSFSWTVNLQGGTPPYVVNVDWGDHTHSQLVYKTDPPINLQHVYKTPGYYAVTVNSTDAHGQTKVMQVTALINNTDGSSPFLAVATKKHPPHATLFGTLKTTHHWLFVAGPAYLIVALMTLSFWLGEQRQVLRQLRRYKSRHA